MAATRRAVAPRAAEDPARIEEAGPSGEAEAEAEAGGAGALDHGEVRLQRVDRGQVHVQARRRQVRRLPLAEGLQAAEAGPPQGQHLRDDGSGGRSAATVFSWKIVPAGEPRSSALRCIIADVSSSTIEKPRTAGPDSGLGGNWRVIVRNDNHNTFDHVAQTLARVLPG